LKLVFHFDADKTSTLQNFKNIPQNRPFYLGENLFLTLRWLFSARLFIAVFDMNNEAIKFTEFPKMGRLSREVVITEKIDGTNASICITEDGQFLTGSRTRWITPQDDNFGFSAWAHAHKDELLTLGKGTHFGEWWGSGIQRGYGLAKGEKRFSLFNVSRFHLHGTEAREILQADPTKPKKFTQELPACVGLVPELWRGIFDTNQVALALETLAMTGSKAAEGFMKPEGVVVFHTAAGVGFKKTLDKDEVPKSLIK